MFKVEDLAASGKEWRSPAFDLLDEKHPAVTGQHHPEATPGVGHKNIQTSAVAAARGEQLGVPKEGTAGTGAVGGTRVASGLPSTTGRAQTTAAQVEADAKAAQARV